MQCPYCGGKMEEGLIHSARRIIYVTKKIAGGTFALTKPGDIVLSKYNMISPECAAYRCSVCKKIIVEYSESDVV